MSQLKLQVGKFYFVKGTTTKLISEVPAGTIEYAKGARFASSTNHLYDEHGTRVIMGELNEVQRRALNSFTLEREATYEENRKLTDTVLNFGDLTVEQKEDYIPRGDPNFQMQIGEVYVSRIGVFELITEVSHRKKNSLQFGSLFLSYDEQGNFQHKHNGASINDLVFMRKPLRVTAPPPDIVKKILGT